MPKTEIALMLAAVLGICAGVLLLSAGLLIGEWSGVVAGALMCAGGVWAISWSMDRD